MFLKQLLLFVCGTSFGVLASAGVFTVLVSVGLIPRFAGKLHVAKKILVLEEAVVFGTLTGGFISIFSDYCHVGEFILRQYVFGADTESIWKIIAMIFLMVFGFFAGVFVGCLALAIAEMLNSIPIFSRRIGFRHGLGIAILAVALGKLVGSLVYFAERIFLAT